VAIIDAQVHAYERDRPGRPWHSRLPGPPEVTGDDMVRAMDAVAVDGALLVSPWMTYQYDPSYILEVGSKYPERFGLITPVDPSEDDVSDRIGAWAEASGAVGVRLILWGDRAEDIDRPGIDRACIAAGWHRLPVCVLCWGALDAFEKLAARHPSTQFVIDHLGIHQPFEPPAPSEPFADLHRVEALSQYPNVAIKVSGVCTLSHEPFPFLDLRKPLGRIFNSFGFERCMWGSDWTRATALVDYPHAVDAFRQEDWLSESERDALMGGTVQRIFGWAPTYRAG